MYIMSSWLKMPNKNRLANRMLRNWHGVILHCWIDLVLIVPHWIRLPKQVNCSSRVQFRILRLGW